MLFNSLVNLFNCLLKLAALVLSRVVLVAKLSSNLSQVPDGESVGEVVVDLLGPFVVLGLESLKI